MAEQEQTKELYELCIEANKDDLMNPHFYDNCKPIENWIDNTIKSISIELGNKYNNDPQYKNMDLGEKGYLYFDEQIKLFFQTMQVEEHVEIYKHKNSYNAICSNLTSAINREYQVTKEIAQPNSLLKLNLFNIYEYWYEANNILTFYILNEKSIANILKKHNVTLEQITNINWIIENRNDVGQIFTEIYKRIKKRTKDLENLKSRANITKNKKKLENIRYPIDKINNDMWGSNNTYKEKNALKYNISNKNKNVYIYGTLDFSNIPGVKLSQYNLTIFEKRVYYIISNYMFQNPTITKFTIDDFRNGIYPNKMAKKQRDRILQAILKLSSIKFYLDTSEAVKQGYKMEEYKYYGDFLPIDVKESENEYGNIVTTLYKKTIIDEENPDNEYKYTPLFDYLLKLNQYITLPISALTMSISYTDTNFELADYLLRIIKSKWYKNKTETKEQIYWKPRKWQLETIYEQIGLTKDKYTRNDNLKRDRTKLVNDMTVLLDDWKKQEIFKDYSITKTNLTIYYKWI